MRAAGKQEAVTFEKVWAVDDVKPFSSVTEIGGVAVMYARSGTKIQIQGYDPATGRRLWSHAASSSGIAGWSSLAPHGVNEKVVYFQDASKADGQFFAKLVVVVDTGSGTVILDLENGSTVPTTDRTLAWCDPRSTSIRTKSLVGRQESFESLARDAELESYGLTYPCDAEGRPSSLPITTPPKDVASFAGGLRVYASPAGLVGLSPAGQ